MAGLLTLTFAMTSAEAAGRVGKTDESPDWFYPAWAAEARYNRPIRVRDTDGALGRYSLRTKELGLKDLARAHGHLCDGLAIAFVELSAVLGKLFPRGVVDRTDLAVVSKPGPCWADAAALMTGARTHFGTMHLDPSVGDGFIVQRVSTGEAFQVRLRPGVFPSTQARLEEEIRATRKAGGPVSVETLDAVQVMADGLARKVLSLRPQALLVIERLEDYHFVAEGPFGERGDVINKDMPRRGGHRLPIPVR